ncbi:MAG: hypothetical protein IRY99_25970 [Isosphaeraceae bacterium]|nr:hypothetical protein [Isosphaeraceae bacterium]
MKPRFATGSASLERGYAWHVYPDPATPGVMGGDTPFGSDEPPSSERPTAIEPPPGVVDFWKLNKNTPGIQNKHDGNSYLVLTETLEPPRVTPGWFVEAARLDASFQLDQRGDRWAHLVRIVNQAESQWGTVQDCEFQIDRT